MKRFIIPLLFLSFSFFSLSDALSQEQKTASFTIISSFFEENGNIPKKYGCSGENINPPLKIENIPAQTKSMALILDDLDASGGSYVHWILWNIDPMVKEIKENSVPEEAVQGTNGFKKRNYGGPCPPTRPHRYVFKIFALDNHIDLGPEATKSDLQKEMKEHIIAEAQIIGWYSKK